MAVYEPGIVVTKGQWIGAGEESTVYFVDRYILCESDAIAIRVFKAQIEQQHERQGKEGL